MTTTESGSALMRRAAAAGTILATVLAMVAPGVAAEPSYPGAGGDIIQSDVGSGSGPIARRLDISIGRSLIVDLPRDAKEVFVANPAVANAVVRSVRKIFLIGVANGATSIFVMDAEGRQIASFEVNVGRDLTVLRQTIRQTIPTGRIDVKPAGDSILLTGSVTSAGDAQQALDIAKAFVGQNSGAGGAAAFTGSVINALQIVGRDQVMIKVSIVEMGRSALKQLGINTEGNWNLLSTAANLVPYGPAVSAGSNIASGIIGGLGGTGGSISGTASFGKNANLGMNLSALEQAGVSRVLAEPSLVAISGETASFLAGGEIPFSINSCSAGVCTPTVTYKEFGIALAFTPIVLSENRISLHVSTAVSQLDKSISDATSGAPGLRTRRAATSLEIPSGGTVVTAGLISSQTGQTISGVPGLINLPILGALFRSRDFQRQDTELMISVTPYIAKPLAAAQVARPDEGFLDATDPQTVLYGRLNRIYGGAGGAPAARAKPGGRVGFITD